MYELNGVYHLLYRGMDTASGREGPDTQYLCLATSKDGITWEKPSLGLVDFRGSKDNNIVAYENGHAFPACFTFLDPRPGVPAAVAMWAGPESGDTSSVARPSVAKSPGSVSRPTRFSQR